MAVPSDVTEAIIKTAGLSDAGNTSSAFSTLATNNWLPEAKEYVWTYFKKARDFQKTGVDITIKGSREYSLPSDYDRMLDVVILDGDTRGTAQAGTSNTITLASADTSTEDSVVGKYILVYSGTGENGYRQVTAFNTSTKVATMDSNWDTTPDATSLYMIVNYRQILTPATLQQLEASFTTGEKARPDFYAEYDNKLFLAKVPDESYYGVLYRYYVNIMKLDDTSSIYTLFLNQFRMVLQKYIEMKALKKMDDTRADKEVKELARLTSYLISKQIVDTVGLQKVVSY